MDHHFIPGIYNYCDRWCERCSFTERCRVFADEAGLSEAQKDIRSEAFWEHLHESLQQALDLIQEHVEEMGIDPDDLENADERIAPELSFDQQSLQSLAKEYYDKAEAWFAARKQLFHDKEESLKQQLEMGIPAMPEALRLTDALEVINWYSYFIRVKLSRALKGLHDEWMLKEFPIQNDANGSAKITLIGIERSLAAWEVIRHAFPEASDELLDILLILGKLRKGIRGFFPKADAFVRPGFDEPELQP